MTPDRKASLLDHIGSLGSVAEADAFRAALRDGGEALDTDLTAAFLRQRALLIRRGAME